ncbi:hypothetical protein M0G43_15635 [Subsaxibacter sp. CAU 1640]|uniref:hypothetical protein n=1 Tax=Subsaxibacter sp. CAU 1640 TaxID=2933271 RepID=UPI002005E12B|nr:hypothetical protein [Subsaxibacter sp. CAU 1640]MCK7592020.1 hypothetical protein [Subsaxibacter sp. CAU 1640]
MKKYYIYTIILTLVLSSCKKEQDPFLVSKQGVGLLNDSTQVKDLKLVFPKDSIANYKGDSTFKIPMNLIEVYEKNGKLLLSLTPKTIADSTSTISNVRIEDSRFKTEKNISTLSRFKDIQAAYKISKIDNLINSIVISVNEINAQFAIDKNQLPANLRYDMGLKIEASQIPDNAKIKYFFINWD